MLEQRDAELIALWIALVVFAFICVWQRRLRRLASRFFAQHDSGKEALTAVREQLEQVNRDCASYAFSADRVARVSVADEPVWVVDGWVTVMTHNGGGAARSVFALVDRERAGWMRRYSDVFEPVMSNSSCPVFWVKLPELMRLTRDQSGGVSVRA